MKPYLTQLGQQLLQIWKQLGVNQRISVSLATLVLLGGLVGLFVWSSHVEQGLLYGKLSDSEASKVIAALDDAKVPYRIGSGGGSIYVPADKVYATRMQLAGKGIPRGDGVGFEIFDKPNFGLSDFIQRANYVRALQGELARTIGQLDDIESARVMIVLPENRLLLDKDKHPTAAVFVRVRGTSPLASPAVNAIRFLVANSVEGLKANFVAVIDNQGNALSENTEEDSLVGVTTTQLAARRNLELYLARKAEGMLEKVLGPGQAIVRVSAEINFDTTSRVEETFDPLSQVIRSQTKNDENVDTTSAEGGGVVGVSANTPGDSNATQQAASPLNSTKNKKTLGTTEYEISKITSNVFQAAGGLKRLSTAVTVAARMEGTGAARKLVPRTEAELEKLRRIVQNALGADTVRGDQVVLEELPFNEQYATDVSQRLERQEREEFWWQVGKTALYPGVALAVVLVLMRLLKRTPVEELPLGIPISYFAHGNGHNGNGNGNGHGRGVAQPDWAEPPNVVTVEVLNQLVRENPNNMTQAIRSWLVRGAPPPK
jgi:flagellar M-ring protein FliF